MENQKKIWLVTLKTNVSEDSILPVEEESEERRCWAFTSFEEAAASMKKLMSAYANTSNKVFDGHGLCTALENYLDERRGWDNYTNPEEVEVDEEFHQFWISNHGGYDDSAESFWKTSRLPEILKAYLTNMDHFSPDSIPEVAWTDYLIGCKLSSEEIFVEGVDDGPCNGISPYFLINTFHMVDPDKEYNFRIRTCFNDNWDYIYIDMTPTTLDEGFTFPLR